MLQTIEVEIDASGQIHPLESLSFKPTGRAYLTLLPNQSEISVSLSPLAGSAAQALARLATPRYAQRPAANPVEVQQRIAQLRHEWDDS